MTPEALRACAERDITTLFRILRDGGLSQRRIADLVGISQSEVSEIFSGRQVQSYGVLERIAEGLDIPRGLMGLAYDEGTEPEVEIDEAVERRKLLALAGAILCGVPVFGEPEPLAVRRALVDHAQRIGESDVTAYEHTMLQLQAL